MRLAPLIIEGKIRPVAEDRLRDVRVAQGAGVGDGGAVGVGDDVGFAVLGVLIYVSGGFEKGRRGWGMWSGNEGGRGCLFRVLPHRGVELGEAGVVLWRELELRRADDDFGGHGGLVGSCAARGEVALSGWRRMGPVRASRGFGCCGLSETRVAARPRVLVGSGWAWRGSVGVGHWMRMVVGVDWAWRMASGGRLWEYRQMR